MLIESSLVDLAGGTIKVASLSLSPNAALSVSPISTVCLYIKRRIKSQKKGKRKGGRITRCTSPFALFSDFSELVALLDLFLDLGSLVATSGLLFEPDKFFAPLIEDLTPKPLKASIFSFPDEQLLLL